MYAQKELEFDFVVIGGGYSGICAAIAAARLGAKTALVQERPVLGGNGSSEIRVSSIGACDKNPWALETGIVHEFMLEERYRNHEWTFMGAVNVISDLVWLDMVRREPNLTLFLNTTIHEVEMAGPERIASVTGLQLGSETRFTFRAGLFCDATGDGTIAFLAGAEWRMGREAASEFGESLAPEEADTMCMGSTLQFRAREMPYPVPYTPPEWAARYPTEDSLLHRDHFDIRGGYWWIEVGGWYDSIRQNEEIRDELLRHVFGVWDHIKNHCERKEKAANWVLDWFGMVPGKRESRRIVGDHIMVEDEVRRGERFPDRVAFGGWFLDLHTMGGILATGQTPEPFAAFPNLMDRLAVSPYPIPYRSLYAKKPNNLLLAGRDISASHVAMGSSRVQLTCGVIGQAAGTAAGMAVKYQTTPRGVYQEHIDELQQELLKHDAYIPFLANHDPLDQARQAAVSASSSAILRSDKLGPRGATLTELEKGLLEQEHRAEDYSDLYVRKLKLPLSQLFPVTGERLDSVALYIISYQDQPGLLKASLHRADNVWDFYGETIATTEVPVPARHDGWLELPFGANVGGLKLARVELQPADGVAVLLTEKAQTGVVGGWKPVADKRWRWLSTANRKYTGMAMQFNPDIHPYQPGNVINGVTRPESEANIWISDPGLPLPQWLELAWAEPVAIGSVWLTFDTDVNMIYRNMAPMERRPESVRHYTLEAWQDNAWRVVYEEKDNYQRHRVCRLAQVVTTNRLRLVVHATNGDPSARLYEIRAYATTD